MKKLLVIAIILGIASGCTFYAPARTSSLRHTSTDIVLHENDFIVAQKHVVGEAECGYVLGAIALGDPHIVSLAWKQMRDTARQHCEGHAAQFVNITEDFITTMNLGIYKIDRYVVSADVITFTR